MKKYITILSLFLLFFNVTNIHAEEIFTNYTKIRNGYVYFGADKINNADADTFKVIGVIDADSNLCQYGEVQRACWYSIDKNNIYRKDKIVTNADSSSFEIIDSNYYRDKNYCFYDDYASDITYIMNNCDRDTLQPLSQYYAKDKDAAYYLGKKMDVKNLDTFRARSGGQYAEDKYAYYNVGEMKEDKTPIYNRVKGKIIIKTEDNGEAYYVHPLKDEIFYLGRPKDAFNVMREQGIGITNDNLKKIPIGLGNLTGSDSDGDGLTDIFEDAIGTDKNNQDTDGDGNNDSVEINNGYNLNGSGKLYYDNSFTDNQKGKIFLQVENNGEAWYINPDDGKRYFLGRPADAFQVMRNFGLGISNNDFIDLQ